MRVLSRVKRRLEGLRSRLKPLWTREDHAGELQVLRRELKQYDHVIRALIRRHYLDLPLPPESLRLHVGTRASGANFLAQGINSSSRVLEVFGDSPRAPLLDWGCGSGRTLRWLLFYEGYRRHYHGCDIHLHPERHRAWYTELHWVLSPGGLAYLTTRGASIIEEHPLPPAAKEEFRATGKTLVRNEGHCKDAAIVSEAFTRRMLEGLFRVEEYRERGYQNMDPVLARRIG